MSSSRLAALNPVDIIDIFNSNVSLRNFLGEKTRDNKQVRALSLTSEREHDAITAVSGLEVVVSSIQSVRVTDLMDGRTVRENELTLFVASYSESLAAFNVKLKQYFGLGNVTSTSLANGVAYASAIGATGASYFAGVVEAAAYKIITGAPNYIGAVGDTWDAPKDGLTYARQNGLWIQGGDGVTQAELDVQLTAAAEAAIASGTANSQGYFYQNSHYFANGLTHVGNPDVIEELEPDTDSPLIFSSTVAGESASYLQAHKQDPNDATNMLHVYDRTTGIISLYNAQPDEFILVRLNIDVNCDSDNSSAEIVLRCTTNSASGGYSFDIEEQLISLDQGADKEYAAAVTVPIFVGDTLAENGSIATIQPLVRFKNTSGDIKPRSLAFFIWS